MAMMQKSKCSFFLAAAFAAASLMADSPAGRYDIYLLGGQSNMAGRGTLTPSNRVSTERVVKLTRDLKWVPAEEPIHFDKPAARAGLAASFARKIADRDPNVIVALVPCAVGGSPISSWQPGRVNYTNMVARAREAMKYGEIKGFLWHQGCSDAFTKKALAAYLPLFTNAITSLRREIGIEDKPFVAGELGPYLVDWK